MLKKSTLVLIIIFISNISSAHSYKIESIQMKNGEIKNTDEIPSISILSNEVQEIEIIDENNAPLQMTPETFKNIHHQSKKCPYFQEQNAIDAKHVPQEMPLSI